MNNIIPISNPLIDHYIGVIRNVCTNKNEFADAIEKITYLMSSQITNEIGLTDKVIRTPVAETTVRCFDDNILIITIMRAGLPMFEVIRKVIPVAIFGYLGMKRDLKNDSANMYYHNLPPDLHKYKIIILDIVIASGNTINFVLKHLTEAKVNQKNITVANIISSRQGLLNIYEKFPEVKILNCKIDDILTNEGMIIPGLGDAGDRLNGYVVSE